MNVFKALFGTAEKNYQDIDAETFLKLFKETPNAVLLDVRTPAEFAAEKINGALNINIFNPGFTAAIAKMDKDKSYFVYCRSGNRSGQACNIMAKQGFTKLYNMAGGIISL